MNDNCNIISKQSIKKNNVHIEIRNYSVLRKFLIWRTNESISSKLNKLWKEIDSPPGGILESIYSDDCGMHILIICGNTIWTVYKGLVIKREGKKTLFRYDRLEKFKKEVLTTTPSNLINI